MFIPKPDCIRKHARLSLLLASLTIASCAFLAWRVRSQPRPWAVNEVPVAFWAWQSDAPSQADVQRAIDQTGARTLFIRAGQIDYERGTCRLIRAINGEFPRGIDLYLVYNATPDLLTEFERIDTQVLVSAIAESYRADLLRASADGAQVAGLQLDIDTPTRLLPRYGRLLRTLRETLPAGTRLSITGLPTWMNSPMLATTLEAVDFWIPQCYGATIPDRLDHATPISSPRAVASAIDGARKLERPFYAGLAAYGYAIHYGRDGGRIQESGTLNPEVLANSKSLDLVERRRFDSDKNSSSEWRFLYRAREACVTGGLVLREGEWLMLDLPTAEALRATAREVRKRAGAGLLGLCVFRLPAAGDDTALTIEEVADALLDRTSTVALEITAKLLSPRQPGNLGGRARVELTCVNTGSTRALLGEDALRVDAHVPAASLQGVDVDGHLALETLFMFEAADARRDDPVNCGVRRANVVRLAKRGWKPGESVAATLEFSGQPPDAIPLTFSVRIDEEACWRDARTVAIVRSPDD